ncbi:kinase-like domain-containing protein [Lipomyces tetrasporus]|uniref:Kinase-like domain-containing protein n=1 Tax=Lipomyces tetrasporus TaxID=54092 RepID=A0AAD7QU34_9ASCO|nr:kinase-like domain-containing protein [Lipomyces tetrasporus]KAJ8099737.1 kinase-like domain-containing protein [Lipomyces tetrasporus]
MTFGREMPNADETGHSSDDSYALPALSSYALALLSTDVESNGVENENDFRKAITVTANIPPVAIPEKGKSLGDSSRRRSSREYHSPSTLTRKSANTGDEENATRRKSSSPQTWQTTTPYQAVTPGLVTPALTGKSNTQLAHIGHTVEPTSHYRSIFRKSKPGRLGPPKRAIRRESQEGEPKDQHTTSNVKSPSASPRNRSDQERLRDDLLAEDGLKESVKEGARLRFSEKDEEIPHNTTRWSSSDGSGSKRDSYTSLSRESDPRRKSFLSTDFADLDIGSSRTSPGNLAVLAISPKTSTQAEKVFQRTDKEQNSSRQSVVYDAKDMTAARKSLSPIVQDLRLSASPRDRDLRRSPSPLNPLSRRAGSPIPTPAEENLPVASPILSGSVEKRTAHAQGQRPTFPMKSYAQERPLSRSLLSPRIDDIDSLRPRPLSHIYYDENRNSMSQQTGQQHPRFQGRQLLTPLSSNIVRPLRTSTPPPECNVFEPPPKMSNLDIPRPTPKAPGKKQKNTVTVAGKTYQRLELLGKGGSSKVYKVQLANSTKIYAMKKVTFDEVDDAVVKGFKGEIELLRKLTNEERVVRLVDFEITEGCVNMVMECGEIDLAHVLASRLNSPIDLSFIRYHAIEMLRCVEAVHRHGIVHSDLKPANFLFVKGFLKIIDFGIANAVPEYTTNVRRETQIGTPNYMAPEALMDVSQLDPHAPVGKKCMKVGRPSDVWSCGCIIYQMVYGKPPYAAYNGTQRMLAIMNPKVQINYSDSGMGGGHVPREAIDCIKGCLDRDPEQRSKIADVLSDPFLRPRYMSKDVLRELLARSVKYGADLGRAESADIELLAEDVWKKIGLLNKGN